MVYSTEVIIRGAEEARWYDEAESGIEPFCLRCPVPISAPKSRDGNRDAHPEKHGMGVPHFLL